MASVRERYSPADKAELKRQVLARMAEGYSQNKAIQMAGVGRATWFRWRDEDPHLISEIDRIVSSGMAQRMLLKKLVKDDIQGEPDWRVKFIKNYRRTRDRNEAAVTAEKTIVEVENSLNPDSDEYDKTFATLLQQEDLSVLWSIEDAAKREAAQGDKQMQRYLLERLMPEKYGKSPSQLTKTTNLYWFSPEGESKAVEKLQEILG